MRPSGHNDREDRAALIEQALSEYGLLAPVHEQGESIEEMAQWLAEVSQFPRYTVEGGWKRILQSKIDVDLAVGEARNKVVGGEGQRLAQVRIVLLRYLSESPPPEPEKV